MKTKPLLVRLIIAVILVAMMSQSDAQITGVDDNIVASNLDGSGFYRLPTIGGVGGDLTIEGWVYLESYASWGRIAELGNGEDRDNIGLGTIGTSGRPVFFVQGFGSVEGPQALGTNTWVHVAGVLQPDRTMRLYVNGTQVATATASGDVPVLDRTSNYVGESNWAADALLDGAVADVRFWNTARTQAEIQNNMPVGSVTGPTTGLVAAYAFGATGAAPTADLSGNGYTATQNGNILYSKFDTGTLTTGGFSGANLNVAEGQLNLTGTNSVGTLTVNNGTVTQAAGSSVTTTSLNNNFVVGESASQSGSYAISGGTLQLGPNANAFIGASGTGTMTQTGGEVTANGFATIGRYSGGVGNYTISAGSLNQAAADRLLIVGEEGTGTLTVSDTGSVTSAGGISIAHAAGGVGTVNLDGGTISAASVSKGSGSTATFNFNGGTLGATGNNANFMSGLDVAEIKAGGAVIDDAGFEIGTGQVLSGTGALEKTGSGRLTLSGNNTYAGTTTISEGTLRVGNDGTTGTLGSGNVVNNATLAFARSDALTVSQAISGTGEVRKWGFGTTTFTGANTFSGDFLQEYGVTVLNRTGGPALYADGGPGELVIANLAGGANFYSAVEMGAANQLGSNVDVTFSPINVASGWSYLSLHGNDTTIGNLKSTANHAAAWGIVQNQESGSFGDSTLTIHQTVDGSFTGEVRDGFGDNVGRLALVKEGAATLTLNSAGSGGLSYSGPTTVNGGTLQLGAGSSDLRNNASDFVINNGSTLAFGGTRFDLSNQSTGGQRTITFGASGGNTLDTQNVNFVDWHGTTYRTTGGSQNAILGAGLNLNAGVVATFDVARGTDAESDLLVSAGIGNAGSIVKTGSGTLTLSGSNTYTGTTTISQGTLQVGNGGTSGNLGTGNVVNNAALVFNRAGSLSVANTISGTGSLTKTGPGTVALSAANSYTGLTTVAAGEFAVNGSLASSLVSVLAGGTLSGTGTLGGDATIAGNHSPGNSPGIQTVAGDLTYSAGSSLTWELIANAADLASRGTAFDGIDVGGNLAFSGATAINLVFDLGESAVDWNDDFWSLDRTGTDGWLIYDTAGTTAGLGNLSVAGSPWRDSLGNSLASIRPNASFGFEQVGSDVYLTFAAVPEPSSVVLMGLGSVIACLALRRRKRPGAALA